jgi:hypothetical protein
MKLYAGIWYVQRDDSIDRFVGGSFFSLTHSLIFRRFTFHSAYPHGLAPSLTLLFTVAAALAATTYGVASCRLLVVSYSYTTGTGTTQSSSSTCFQDYFASHSGTSNLPALGTSTRQQQRSCATGIGLFQWMQPFSTGSTSSTSSNNATTTADSSSWKHGYCVGYQQSTLATLQAGNSYFDVGRTFGILAVLASFVVLAWTLVLSCLQMNTLQCCLFRLLCYVGALTSGFAFAIKKASLCTQLFDARACTLDKGGLAMITGCILWFVASLVSTFFLQTEPLLFTTTNTNNNNTTMNETGNEATTARDSQRNDSLESQKDHTRMPSKSQPKVTIDHTDNQDLEVYLKKRVIKNESDNNSNGQQNVAPNHWRGKARESRTESEN